MKATLIFAVILISPLPTFEIAGNQNANIIPQTGDGNQAASIEQTGGGNQAASINQAGKRWYDIGAGNQHANIGPQTGGGNQAASINQAGNRSAKGSGIQLPPVETFGLEHRQNAKRKRGGATHKVTNRKMQFGGQSANNNANINQAGFVGGNANNPRFVGGNANNPGTINQAGGFGGGNANGGGIANANINQAGIFGGGNANYKVGGFGGGNANASINQAGGFVGGNANVDQPTSQPAPNPEVDQHEPFF